MANSDPRALRLFISWARSYFDENAEFSVQLHLHEGNVDRKAQYWAGETGLGMVTFHKTFIKPKGTGHRKNHLPHGVCTVKMKRCADSWQRTMAWIEGTSTYLGLDPTPR